MRTGSMIVGLVVLGPIAVCTLTRTRWTAERLVRLVDALPPAMRIGVVGSRTHLYVLRFVGTIAGVIALLLLGVSVLRVYKGGGG